MLVIPPGEMTRLIIYALWKGTLQDDDEIANACFG